MAGAPKGAERDGRTVVWIDESGFYLLPAAVRTDAPVGRTPVLRVPLTRAHLSAISAITPAGHLFLPVQPQAIRGPDLVRFLQHLLRHLPGELLVLRDGSPIHRAQVVKDVLAAGGAARIRLEQLPGDAPELNPDEGIRSRLTHVEPRNRCCPTLWHPRGGLGNAIARLRRKPHLIRACIRHAGCLA